MDYAFDLKRFLCIFRFMIKRTVEEQILRTISFFGKRQAVFVN